MTEKIDKAQKISMSNTKQEILEAYKELQKSLKEQKEAELKPEKKAEEKKTQEVVKVADSLSVEGVTTAINSLRQEVNRMLGQIAERMEEEVSTFKSIKQAIEKKEKDFQELFEIEREAETLAALIETQHQKRREFDEEMSQKKAALQAEIETTRAEWKTEQAEHEAFVKEQAAEEKKKRDREKEEFAYSFERDKKKTLDAFEEEKAQLEKEIQRKREELERMFEDREKALVEKESELEALRKRAQEFPQELSAAVDKAVKDTAERLTQESTNKINLLTREFDGERNVLNTRIESLDQTVKVQKEQIARYSDQLEQAYQKVQDIAVKTVEGSSQSKAIAGLQQMLAEKPRAQGTEK